VIVLVSAAVGTSVQIGRSRSYHSPVAGRAVLTCHSIDVACLVLHCQVVLGDGLSCNVVLALVLLHVLLLTRSVIIFFFFSLIVHDQSHSVLSEGIVSETLALRESVWVVEFDVL